MRTIDIPLAFRDSPNWPSDNVFPAVSYSEKPYRPNDARATVQKVLAGRRLLTPQLDLNAYNCRAEIDWIEFRLPTKRYHQARNMQPKVAGMFADIGSASTVYVSGPTRKPGYMGYDFIIKVQQPKPRELVQVLGRMAAFYRLERSELPDLPIMGLEISVDFYVKDTHARTENCRNLLRWQMVDALRRHLKPDPALTELPEASPRFFGDQYGGNGATFFVNGNATELSPKLITLAPSLGLAPEALVALDIKSHNQPNIDVTSWIGAKGFEVMLRTMDKTTDQRDPGSGTFRKLSSADSRARLEVTLQGQIDEVGGHGAFGFKKLGDLQHHLFKAIRRTVFEFFLPTLGNQCDSTMLGVKLRANEEEVFRRSGVYGLDRFQRGIQTANRARADKGEKSAPRVRLGDKGRMVSWTDMNQKVDRALKKLGRDWEALF